MITWTEAANEALEEHMAAIAPELLALGLSPSQVALQLRISIDEELARTGLGIAGRAEVLGAIAKLAPAFMENLKRPARSPSDALGWWTRSVSMIFGTVIPVTALGVEMFTGMSAEVFDPIPTLGHVLAIAFVAISNGWMTVWLSRERLSDERVLPYAIGGNAVAIGIAAYYALWYAPITPYAVIGIVAFGLGLLPLSPLMAMSTGLLLRWKLRKRTGAGAALRPKLWMGALAGFVGLLAMEMPTVFTQWASMRVADGTPAEQQQWLPVLRRFGSEELLLRNCHWGRHRDEFRDAVLVALLGGFQPEAARQVYYRVTGRSHTQAKIPVRLFQLGGMRQRDWTWDQDLGGGVVGQKFEELKLKESRLDGSVDGEGATGYFEWTLVFRNDNTVQQREARALVQLPPGAVVSRLTLWIDGEEREAAFGGRSQVRQAYQAVVQRRRDPVMVSYRGADRVLLQCFPVQPNGGEMKVRFGISLPLVLDAMGEAKTGLPKIIERNFSESPGLRHAVWIESKNQLTTTASEVSHEQTAAGEQAVAFSFLADNSDASAVSVTVERDPAVVAVQAADTRDRTRVIRQEFRRTAAQESLFIVLDGAQGMEPATEALAAVLEKISGQTPVRIMLAGDSVRECPHRQATQAADWLRRQEFVGGQDATDALASASTALGAQSGKVVWIHGTQPMIWKSAAALEQKLARSGATLRFMALAGVAAPNELVEKMASAGAVVVQPRLGPLEADISRVLHRVREGGIELHRELAAGDEQSALVHPASDQVVRLWAVDEIKRLMRGRQAQQEEAVRLAVAMQLVTPVSSAVVLETKAQYDAAGLQPANPDTVPTVPDGAPTLVLLLIALVGLGFFTRYSKYRGRGEGCV